MFSKLLKILIPHFELNTETAQLIQAAALMHETGMTTEPKNMNRLQ